MWGHYVALALRSTRRSKALTALVVALLAFGPGVALLFLQRFRRIQPLYGESGFEVLPVLPKADEPPTAPAESAHREA